MCVCPVTAQITWKKKKLKEEQRKEYEVKRKNKPEARVDHEDNGALFQDAQVGSGLHGEAD